MRGRGELSKIGLLVVMFTFLAGGSEAAFAKGAVTINVAKGGAPPKVFIVSENAKGELVRTPISAEGTRVEIPDGSRIEIMSADPNAMIKVEGDIEVAVQGGSPTLQLSGDTLLNVGAQVEQMHVMVESGRPSVISRGGTMSLTPGQQATFAIVNNELNVRPIEVLPTPVGAGLTAGQAATGIPTPGGAAQTAQGAAQVAGSVPPQGLPTGIPGLARGSAAQGTMPGTFQGVTGANQQGLTGSFPGALQGFSAPYGTTTPTGVLAGSAIDPATGLSRVDISLLNSLSPTGQAATGTVSGTTLETGSYSLAGTGDGTTASTDPFASLSSDFATTDTTALATTTTGTTTTFDPTASTTMATATETFIAQTESTATTSTTEPLPIASTSN